MPFKRALEQMTDNHLWALLTVAEHPGRISIGDPVQHGRYQLHSDSVYELYRDGWLTTTTRGWLHHPEDEDATSTGPALERAQRRFDSYAFPTAALHHRPQQLTDDEHEFMREYFARGSLLPSQVSPEEELMIISLHQRALMEPKPRHPEQARVSAAGMMAIGRQPEFGGLARMCAQARFYNGGHWSPDRHHRYTGLCTPPGAPATTWRRDVNRGMAAISELAAAEARWHTERAKLENQERAVYADIPYELNYYPSAYDKEDDHG